MKKWICFFLFCLLLFLCGCEGKEQTRTEYALNTVITVTLYEGGSSEAMDGCISLLHQYENMLSATVTGSDVDQINHSNGAWVNCHPETAELIRAGIRYGELSGGWFDITIQPVSFLWHFSENEGEVPAKTDISQAVRTVDYRNIELDGNRVRLQDSGMGIDLGAIAKGYIGDQMAKYLVENGVTRAILNLGGNVIAIGEKEAGKPFQVGIQMPFGEGIAATVDASDQSVVTSGTYQRYFEVDGKRYHHLLDPHTGYPAEREYDSVTVVAKDGMTADCLSTACFLLGKEESEELLKQADATAYFVTADGDVTQIPKVKGGDGE